MPGRRSTTVTSSPFTCARGVYLAVSWQGR